MKNNILRRTLAALALATLLSIPSFAQDTHISYESDTEASQVSSPVATAAGVTEAMCDASYWAERAVGDKDKVLMTHEEIDIWNKKTQDASGTSTCNIANTYAETYDADSSRQSLGNLDQASANWTSHDTIYVDGTTYNREDYLTGILQQVLDTGYTETSKTTEYAVGIRRTALKSFPILKEVGWSAADPDDENQIAVIDVNEPMVIRGKAVVDGHVFYCVKGDNCNGWVDGEHIAICHDKTEWLDAWKVDSNARDFIVVTQDKIVLEKSHKDVDISEIKLTLGTVLKLVPEDQTAMVGERGTWNNYVVYLPTRDADGMYVKKMALISQHLSVSVGYPDYTQANVMKIAFSCLGDRYGWGGSDDATDCTLYARLVYKCFGFQMPRNTTWQCNVPVGIINMSSMTEEEKGKLLSTCPAGTLMYFSDLAHGMIYTGCDNGTCYSISNTGTLYDTTGEYKQEYNIILNPMTCKRGNGKTWLYNTDKIMLPAGPSDISNAKAILSDGKVSVTYGNTALYEGLNYTVTEESDTFLIEGINNFKGSLELSKTRANVSLDSSDYTYTGNPICPEPSVTYLGAPLTKDTDYTVSYENNVNAGEASINITGTGSYSFAETESFTISPANISEASFEGIPAQTDGNESIQPSVAASYNDKKLTQDIEYTLSYQNNQAVGTGSITVTGKGNFQGSTTLSFEIIEHTHVYAELEIPSTCTQEGQILKICGICGKQIQKGTIDPKSHDFGEWETAASTCSKSGYKARTCNTCGYIETENLVLEDHEWKESATIDHPASCTSDGSESIHCRNCSSIKDMTVIPAKGHTYSDWTEVIKPTCKEKGKYKRTCSTCKETEYLYTSLGNHSYVTETIPAKVGISGKTYQKCRICGHTEGKKVLPALKPVKTKIIKLSKGKKSFTVKWSKKKYTGYQIRYSTKQNMSSAKKVTIKKASTVSKKIKKLKKKKTYYVQIRTYKQVGEKKYFSKWSAKKKVTTK